MSCLSTTERTFGILFLAALTLFSCRKDSETDLVLGGVVRNARTGSGISNASVTLREQVVEGGTFGGSFTTAGSATTDGSGNYEIRWPRANIAGLRVTATRTGFFSRELELNPDDFSVGERVDRNIALYPKATIVTTVANLYGPLSTDLLEFRFVDADFDCACCDTDWKEFPGAQVDSTFSCDLYGDTWLKYQVEVSQEDGDSLALDSIWCPAFATVYLSVHY